MSDTPREENASPIKQRVLRYIEAKQLGKREFGRMTNTFSQMFSEKGSKAELNGRTIVNILNAIPTLSAEWLCRGVGEMELGLGESLNASGNTTEYEKVLEETLELMRQRVKDLENEIAYLNKELSKTTSKR